MIIKATEFGKYMALKEKGYRTVWSGEGKICMEKPSLTPRDQHKIRSCFSCDEQAPNG
jgi:hypothetical protein